MTVLFCSENCCQYINVTFFWCYLLCPILNSRSYTLCLNSYTSIKLPYKISGGGQVHMPKNMHFTKYFLIYETKNKLQKSDFYLLCKAVKCNYSSTKANNCFCVTNFWCNKNRKWWNSTLTLVQLILCVRFSCDNGRLFWVCEWSHFTNLW